VSDGEAAVAVFGDGEEGLLAGEVLSAPSGGQDDGGGAAGFVRFSEGCTSNNCHFPVSYPVTSVILLADGKTVKGGGGGGFGTPCW